MFKSKKLLAMLLAVVMCASLLLTWTLAGGTFAVDPHSGELFTLDELLDYSITVLVSGDGTAFANVYTAKAGVQITLSAFAESGYTFKEWQITGGVAISGNSFTMPFEDVTVTAVFETEGAPPPSARYYVSVTDGTGGGEYAENEVVTISVNDAPEGQRFTQWSISQEVTFVDGTGVTDATVKFSMPGNDVMLTAEFEQIPATVTDVTIAPPSPSVQKGTTQQFNATVNGRYDPPQDVTWGVSGGVAGTIISDDGLLTVAANETATTLTVTATSVYDTAIYGTATVREIQLVPVYGLSLSPTAHTFAGAHEGYAAQMALSVTITNSGNKDTLALAAALTGTNAGSFTLSTSAINDIAVGGTASFGVTPNTGLGVGAYSATVTVTGANGLSASLTVSFTVVEAPYDPAAELAQNAQTIAGVTAKLPAEFTASAATDGNTASEIKTFVENALADLGLDGAAAVVTISPFNESVPGSAGTPAGTDGSFTASITLSKGVGVTLATDTIVITGTLTAAAYVPSGGGGGGGGGGGATGGGSGSGDNTNTGGDSDTDDGIVVIDDPETPGSAFDGWENPYIDVHDTDWFAEAVRYVTEKGLMQGTSHNTFSPNSTLTRAMFLTILARKAGVDTDGGETWYEKAIEWAVENGISDGTNPNAAITREQIVAILYRYTGSPDASGYAFDAAYTDVGDIAEYATDAMKWAVGTGLVTGTTPTTLSPKSTATRAQAATLYMRYDEVTSE
jgi:hypothetical protein